jgi:hypothetical protein
MKEYLESIERNFFTRSMKNLLYAIPVGLITNNIYVFEFGKYSIYKDKFFEYLFTYNTIYTVVCFCLVYLTAYILELMVLPPIFVFLDLKFKDLKYKLPEQKIIKIVSFNPYKYINDTNICKVYEALMFYPMTIILWLIAANTLITYILILFIIFITIIVIKILNTIIYAENKQIPNSLIP